MPKEKAPIFSPGALFGEALLETMVIAKRRDFEALFAGFKGLKAITYVASPELLLEFMQKRGYERVEVLVGENLSETYRQSLAEQGTDAVIALARYVAAGELRILVPTRTIHTKLYILDRPGATRLILTSANLTETARQASRQMNYAWYSDFAPEHPWLLRVLADYKKHLESCELFMGDLTELLRGHEEKQQREVVDAWLKGSLTSDADAEVKMTLGDVTAQAMVSPEGPGDLLLTVKLPEAPAASRQVERYLAPLSPTSSGREMRFSAAQYLRYVQESHGIPVMAADFHNQELRLSLDGQVRTVSQALPAPSELTEALTHVEAYIETVDSGQAPSPDLAKASMFEALLYIMAAPFAHEFMRAKRGRFGAIDSRGPRFLYIYGPSQNGKSTFLRFALKLVAGAAVEPLNGAEFTKRKVLGAANAGTVFPLLFDDVVLSQRYGLFEEVLKSYWEIWWKDSCPAPQIVIATNMFTLKEWAKSRIKRVDFDVHFAATAAGKEKLAKLFAVNNPLYRWFSKVYLEQWGTVQVGDDELFLARQVMRELYRQAGRPLPAYFPQRPIEELYDPGQRAWGDLVHHLGKAKINRGNDRLLVEFSDDLQYHEIRE
ncbi:MAG: hypothetical protein AABZ44_02195, partial [Elusimicrobiota bacterium]